MKVSIIIPVYNVGQYIADCLQSVICQTMTEDVECILVDDCGQDNSVQIAEQIIADYQGDIKFSVLHHEQNKGLSGARNTGIRAAQGDYLYFLDSDDTITSDCIQSLWTMTEKFPEVDCVFAGANVSVPGLYKWMDFTNKSLPDYSDDRDWLQESMLKRYDFSMTAWNRLVSRRFVEANNLYFEEGFIHEDELWNLAISQVIKSAAFLKINTYNYIVRDNSITTGAIGKKNIFLERRFRLFNRLIDQSKGYRKGIQPYYVVIFSRECLKHISSFSDYVHLMKIGMKAVCKSDRSHAKKILRLLASWNKQLLLKTLNPKP